MTPLIFHVSLWARAKLQIFFFQATSFTSFKSWSKTPKKKLIGQPVVLAKKIHLHVQTNLKQVDWSPSWFNIHVYKREAGCWINLCGSKMESPAGSTYDRRFDISSRNPSPPSPLSSTPSQQLLSSTPSHMTLFLPLGKAGLRGYATTYYTRVWSSLDVSLHISKAGENASITAVEATLSMLNINILEDFTSRLL